MMNMIGTDIEYFVTQQGVISSAIGFIGGSKATPLLVENGNLQEDNVLAEFAVDPCTSADEFVNKIRSVEAQLINKLDSHGLGIIRIPSYHFEKEQLIGWGEQALELGCSPDFNAYEMMDNPRPSGLTRLRTAAGHVHFSYEHPNMATTASIIKCLDYTLGLWSVLKDPDTDRRELYGKAGSCRIKAYGGEYRVLSNFWLEDDADIRKVYEITEKVVNNYATYLPLFQGVINEHALQRAINEHQVDIAEVSLGIIEGIINAELR